MHEKKKKKKKMCNFLKACACLARHTSYDAGTCTADLVLFEQEITELHKIVIFLCQYTQIDLFSWAAWHTTVCLDKQAL